MFLHVACLSILRAEKENGYSDGASILGLALAGKDQPTLLYPYYTPCMNV